MMMARDSTPPRPELSASSLEDLRRAFTGFLRDGEATSLQTALRRIAAEARAKRMRADELLLQLKDVWYQLPEVSGAREGEEQDALLQRVVMLCIREYYAD